MTCSEKLATVALAVLLLGGCQGGEAPRAVVVEPRPLSTAGPLADPRAEISGMAWHGDTLLLLPQYPDQFGDYGDQTLFGLSRQMVLDAVDGRSTAPLEPIVLHLEAPWLSSSLRGYQGREAIAVAGDRYFMTIEVMNEGDMAARMVAGRFLPEGAPARLTLEHDVAIPLQVNLPALSCETLVVDGERVIAIGEANGLNVNPEPRARAFDFELNAVGSLPMPRIEYRVTDATALDADRRFWVLNYFFPAEKELLQPGPDPELARFGAPAWIVNGDPRVERLLELQITDDDRIVRTDTPPLWIRPRADHKTCCNWEAVVRLGDRGFLLMTDEYPATILAFVSLPDGDVTD